MSIQLISKTNFTDHLLVPVNSSPSSLPPNSVRIKTRLISLSTNTVTYARLGGIPGLNWWNVWQIPSLTSPPPNLDAYCRISAWGYSEVIESTLPSLSSGTWLFGYQPIGTHPEILTLSPGEAPGHFAEVSEFRKSLHNIYNRYVAVSEPGYSDEKALESNLGVLFMTGYLINRFVFSFEQNISPVHPVGVKELSFAWTEKEADITDATIVFLACSGKTALSLAHELKYNRPEGKRVGRIVGVGSEKSRGFSEGTGLFDEVLLYEDVDKEDLDAKLGIVDGKKNKIVLVEFGARGDAPARWAKALQEQTSEEILVTLVIGADPLGKGRSELAAKTMDPTSGVYQVNAGGLRDRAIGAIGLEEYWKQQDEAGEEYKQSEAVKSVKIQRGKGIEGWKEGWDALAGGEYGADVAMVYEF
ncbi:hypothetical protein QBC38DRAFT_485918 [Podospora fimiseda]|uniref:Uncharacterized protein n=1 Tax=Podospora fimiseda TaxID=252190 RepID=A0AAN7BJ43_9PEZI|nr:hypothetical protein QBC38DRAFT_485918 [Podospora fimiseda]